MWVKYWSSPQSLPTIVAQHPSASWIWSHKFPHGIRSLYSFGQPKDSEIAFFWQNLSPTTRAVSMFTDLEKESTPTIPPTTLLYVITIPHWRACQSIDYNWFLLFLLIISQKHLEARETCQYKYSRPPTWWPQRLFTHFERLREEFQYYHRLG